MVNCWGSGEVASVIDTLGSKIKVQVVAGSNDSSHVDRALANTCGVFFVGVGDMDKILN